MAKVCPVGSFRTIVNCLEAGCAWWNGENKQCCIKSLAESAKSLEVVMLRANCK